MTISVYGKVPKNPQDRELIKSLFEDLIQAYDKIIVWQPFFESVSDIVADKSKLTTFSTKEELTLEPSVLLSLGGDGTMLDTVDYVIGTDIAVLGINLGHLGFLTTAGRSDIQNIVREISLNKFTIEKRPLLQTEYSFECTGRKYAVNETCFLSTNRGSIIDLEVFVNGKYVSTFSGDGLLIATPTGSTAYSMSAGGPIITPDSKCLCLTPIAPHNLTFRPVIISDHNVIKVSIPNSDNPCKMLMDGYSVFERSGEHVTIRKAPYDWNLVRLQNQDFFLALRNKLMWGTALKSLSGDL
ncbi:MAG: NAD(+)/NADH kinase [Bacteroidales bacterium]|nr:NAD(+)/NADH kinase [Bacteroidales bacterium]